MRKFKVFASKSRRPQENIDAANCVNKRRIVASILDDKSPEHQALSNYLPPTGEGDTKASQIATAVFKLVFRWFNDGDVYDNSYYMQGWANDLSSYANWLYKYVPATQDILDRIYDCNSEEAYEEILSDLMVATGDAEDLENWEKEPKQGSVYNCNGPFKWIDLEAEDEEYEDSWEDDEDEY